MIRQPPRSTLSSSSAASDVYKRQGIGGEHHDRENGRDGARDDRRGIPEAISRDGCNDVEHGERAHTDEEQSLTEQGEDRPALRSHDGHPTERRRQDKADEPHDQERTREELRERERTRTE